MSVEFLAGVGAALMLAGAVRFYEKRAMFRKRSFSDHLPDRVEIQAVIRGVVQSGAAQRVLIIRTGNGGGLPTFNNPLYFQVLYEDFVHPFYSVLQRYRRMPVEGVHSEVLNILAEKGEHVVLTDSMPPGLFQTMDRADGVHISHKFRLVPPQKSHKHFYYVAFCANEAGEQALTSDSGQVVIEAAVSRLREIFENVKE